MNFNAVFIRNVVFPFMEILKGNNIRKNLDYLQKNQFMPKKKLISIQKQKLKQLLLHCVENVPAYLEFKHLTEQISEDPFSALTQLPILTKQDFTKSSEQYLSLNVDKNTLIPNRTGGSTGEPVQFYLDRKTVEFYEAARWRGLSWWDINIGDSSAMIWGSPIELNQQQKLIYRLKERFLKNRIVIPAYNLNPKSLNNYLAALNKFKPQYIYGYASALFLFAQMIEKNNLPLNLKLKGIVSTAETIHDFQREKIERVFKCKTINEYGARDGGIIAYQCPKGKMHITLENTCIEIVDLKTKKPVKPGETGLALVTDLNNFSMPRLRYQLGDIAALSAMKCDCGLNLPILENIQGREDDMFIAIDGTFIHGHFFNHIARNLEGIKQFQIIQRSRTDVLLKIIKDSNYNESQIFKFEEKIKEALGSDIKIELQFVDVIQPSTSGKIRYAIREFPL